MHYIAAMIAVHCYLLAKSKGYSTGSTIAAGIVSTLCAFFFSLPGLIPAALLWGVLLSLKTKPGAPGKRYFTIEFACPECGERIAFHREREGTAQLCPKCGEIVRVPRDDGKMTSKGGEHHPSSREIMHNEGGTFGGMDF